MSSSSALNSFCLAAGFQAPSQGLNTTSILPPASQGLTTTSAGTAAATTTTQPQYLCANVSQGKFCMVVTPLTTPASTAVSEAVAGLVTTRSQ